MKKILWIDIAKGIGILSVVAGHVYIGDIKNIIFLFHMPLFFFISGFLFKPHPNIKQYFRNKSIHLLIPYVAYLFPIYFLFNLNDFSFIDSKDLLLFITKPIIGGRLLIKELGVFWFIPVLFASEQIINILFVKIKKRFIPYFILLFLLLSYTNSLFLKDFWLPLNINVVVAAIPIFYIAHTIKNRTKNIHSIFFSLYGNISHFRNSYLPSKFI